MYRNDIDAMYQRAQVLDRELNQARSGRAHDAARIAQLEAELRQTRQALMAIQAQSGYQVPGAVALPSSNATTVLVLGILSLALCSLLGPFAWHMGTGEVQRMDQGLVDASARGSAVAGRVCGIVATVMLCLSGLFVMFALAA